MVSSCSQFVLHVLIARLLISATSYAAFALLFILLYEVTDNEHRAILAFVSSAVGLTLMAARRPRRIMAATFLVFGPDIPCGAHCFTGRVEFADSGVSYLAACFGDDSTS
ncbi:hypothetical protein HPB48_026045 [Haemaphysalis longicornis]|uniref:Uncharacterized protein n=1 Tax=Haemaphysalis longicornis TaxID=44386 RepID=A0A9J6H8J6_HAELO|nr:hypothetical protein HPB48_026045 [Haemaphysalis longicornis]